MRKLLLIAGVAALAVPGLAAAQPGCAEQQHDSRVAGTVVGAGLGALLGGSLAGHGSKGEGAVLGAVGGGVLGNVAGGASVNCERVADTGYYDADGVWHAGSGYYDRDGHWVNVAPAPYAGDYGSDVAYTGEANDLDGRETWLEQRIHEGNASGAISRGDAEHDFDTLAGIRQFQARRADANDGLTREDRADVMNKLDNLTAIVRSQWSD